MIFILFYFCFCNQLIRYENRFDVFVRCMENNCFLYVSASQKHQVHAKKASQCLSTLLQATSTGPGSTSVFTKNLQSSSSRCCFTQIKSVNPDIQNFFVSLLFSISLDKVMEYVIFMRFGFYLYLKMFKYYFKLFFSVMVFNYLVKE